VAAPTAESDRRRISGEQFDRIRRLAYDKFGCDLRPGKEQLVTARLERAIRARNLASFEDYYRLVLEDSTGQELSGMIDALTTNYTSFFRERRHFDFLREVILPGLRGRDRIRVWSAACSTGEESYSIAFSLLEHAGWLAPDRIRILATDISTRVLRSASRGVYPGSRLADVPAPTMRRFLLRSRFRDLYRVKPEVRRLVSFRRLNLIEPLPEFASFPVIFCRNVLIYFDKATREKVVRSLSDRLEPGGWLLVGHAESLTGVRHGLAYVQPAVYRKASPEGEA
jgi:chemotaxis protein methyltransferase CheR